MISAQEAKKLTIEVRKRENELNKQIKEFEEHIKKAIENGFFEMYITYSGHVECINFLKDYGYKANLIKKTEKTETWYISWENAEL